MNKYSIAIALAAAWFVGSSHDLSAQFFQIPASGGLTDGISDNGVASSQGFFWTESGGLTPIGGTPPGNGVGNQAKISNDGTRISGSLLGTVSGLNEAAYYDIPTATWNLLGGLGGMCGTEISGGWSISGDGQMVVGLAWTDICTDAHAFVGNLDGLTDLGSTVADRSSRANAVDFDGNVVVGWQDGAGRQGAVWVDGTQELIFLPGGGIAQEAFAVSSDGTWVTGIGIGQIVGPPGTTYRYNTVTNVTQTISNLAAGGQRFLAGTAITDDGSMIVGGTWGGGPAIFGMATIWVDGVGTMLFRDFLDANNVKYPAGYNFAFVSDVSSNGEWFTGWSLAGPQSSSWVIRIPQTLLGDVNLDGMVSLLDVAPFVDLITSGNFQAEADINGDGVVNLLDVAPFVDVLTNP